MRPIWRTAGIATLAVALCALAVGELVLDWRLPRSDFAASHALGVNVAVSLVPYNKLTQEMKEKYGDRARVSFQFPPGRTSVERDGQIIHEETPPARLNDVIGLFMVGKRDAGKRDEPADMRFPFRLAPDQDIARVERSLATALRNRFGKALPQRSLSFSDQDWSIDRCTPLPAGLGLGGAGLLMRLGRGAACIVTWRRSQPGPVSMLISVSVASGDPWMRPFTRRLCRTITETALAQIDRGERDRPAYAACILADRPDRRGGAQDMLSSYAYSVGPQLQLARMD